MAQSATISEYKRSLQLWATEHRGALVAGTLAIAAFITTLIAGSKPLARSLSRPVGL
jgi:hypothetical protein